MENAFTFKICNGPKGCPNAMVPARDLVEDLVEIFDRLQYDAFLKEKIQGDIRSHHQFKIAIAYCPNSCSMPQIVDLGIVAASPVTVTGNPCSQCGACEKACQEKGIALGENGPTLDQSKCLYCGKCAQKCPTGTIKTKELGFRIMLGGKLGRHPRLATELPGIFSRPDVGRIVEKSLKLFMEHHSRAKRFADLFSLYDTDTLTEKIL